MNRKDSEMEAYFETAIRYVDDEPRAMLKEGVTEKAMMAMAEAQSEIEMASYLLTDAFYDLVMTGFSDPRIRAACEAWEAANGKEIKPWPAACLDGSYLARKAERLANEKAPKPKPKRKIRAGRNQAEELKRLEAIYANQ